MSLPDLCETCGTRHHAYQGHVFPPSLLRVTSERIEEKRGASVGVVKKPAQRAKAGVANHVANHVANAVTNTVANANRLEQPAKAVRGQAAARGTSTERVKRWRAANRGKYNAAQRERMRARRAARRVSA